MNYIFKKSNTNELIDIDKEIFKDVIQQLLNTKKKIDNYTQEWDIVKKMIHEYEYIYTSSYYKKNISIFSPISRSYFKMTEINKYYNLLNQDKKYTITCLAEAPGGFIQSLLYTKKILRVHAITLLSENKNVPFWNKILLKNPLISFHKGIKGNGDLYDIINVISFIKNIGKSSIDLVTGDGGFDCSNDYNNQEYNSLRLIYSEIFIAINIQKEKGSFVCKIFDIFLEETIQLVYILYLSYENIYFHKPCISRFSNSEKYIVCKGFKGYNKDLVNLMIHSFETNKLNIQINKDFFQELYNFNNKYSKYQISHIEKGIENIKNNTLIRKPTKQQINDAIHWCNLYNININYNCIYLNRTIS